MVDLRSRSLNPRSSRSSWLRVHWLVCGLGDVRSSSLWLDLRSLRLKATVWFNPDSMPDVCSLHDDLRLREDLKGTLV